MNLTGHFEKKLSAPSPTRFGLSVKFDVGGWKSLVVIVEGLGEGQSVEVGCSAVLNANKYWIQWTSDKESDLYPS
eukprot:scaffold1812_cov181-Alexandrium_tamarense.AAC.12